MALGLVKMAQSEEKQICEGNAEEESAGVNAEAPGRSDFAAVPSVVSEHPWKPGDQAS